MSNSRYTQHITAKANSIAYILAYLNEAEQSNDTVGVVRADLGTHLPTLLYKITSPILNQAREYLPDEFRKKPNPKQVELSAACDKLTSTTSYTTQRILYFLSTLPQSAQFSSTLQTEVNATNWLKLKNTLTKDIPAQQFATQKALYEAKHYSPVVSGIKGTVQEIAARLGKRKADNIEALDNPQPAKKAKISSAQFRPQATPTPQRIIAEREKA